MIDLKEWQKEKVRAIDINKWTAEFNDARGNHHLFLEIHKKYLKSNIWKEIRAGALLRANCKCEYCKHAFFDQDLDVHHLNYDRIGGHEIPSDLKVLCFACHLRADKARDSATEEKQEQAYIEKKLSSMMTVFAIKNHGDDWRDNYSEEEIIEELKEALYKRYCIFYNIHYSRFLDHSYDDDFLEFESQFYAGKITWSDLY